jgi:hypothetical protein
MVGTNLTFMKNVDRRKATLPDNSLIVMYSQLCDVSDRVIKSAHFIHKDANNLKKRFITTHTGISSADYITQKYIHIKKKLYYILGSSIAGIAGSNPVEGMNFRLLGLLCVV